MPITFGHEVTWMEAVFVGDPDAIPGAKQRAFRWLSSDEFNDALSRLTVRDDDSLLHDVHVS